MATTIGKGLRITGTLTADEPVVIAGTLRGEVLASNHAVTVAPGGRLDGAVTARVITVQGVCAGRLVARDLVRVLDGATVQADIASPRLGLEEGATFDGRVEGGTKADAAARVAAYRRLQSRTPASGPPPRLTLDNGPGLGAAREPPGQV